MEVLDQKTGPNRRCGSRRNRRRRVPPGSVGSSVARLAWPSTTTQRQPLPVTPTGGCARARRSTPGALSEHSGHVMWPNRNSIRPSAEYNSSSPVVPRRPRGEPSAHQIPVPAVPAVAAQSHARRRGARWTRSSAPAGGARRVAVASASSPPLAARRASPVACARSPPPAAAHPEAIPVPPAGGRGSRPPRRRCGGGGGGQRPPPPAPHPRVHGRRAEEAAVCQGPPRRQRPSRRGPCG